MKQDLRETIGLVLVAGSMVFVGFQIRWSNVQARAAAYQELGIAVSEYHQNISPLEDALELEAHQNARIRTWTLDDWTAYSRLRLASLRLAETFSPRSSRGCSPRRRSRNSATAAPSGAGSQCRLKSVSGRRWRRGSASRLKSVSKGCPRPNGPTAPSVRVRTGRPWIER
jgi:hypothetical protein